MFEEFYDISEVALIMVYYTRKKERVRYMDIVMLIMLEIMIQGVCLQVMYLALD